MSGGFRPLWSFPTPTLPHATEAKACPPFSSFFRFCESLHLNIRGDNNVASNNAHTVTEKVSSDVCPSLKACSAMINPNSPLPTMAQPIYVCVWRVGGQQGGSGGACVW